MTDHDREELLIFNARFEPVGTTTRRVVHREGLWHETFHCWIVSLGGDGEGRLLFQRRSSRKHVWPSRLDASAGGHLAPGERLEVGVLREIKEEIGITVDEAQLVPVGLRVGVDEFVEGIKNHELLHVFMLHLDIRTTDWFLDDAEVHSLLAVRLPSLLNLFAGTEQQASVELIASSRRRGCAEVGRGDSPAAAGGLDGDLGQPSGTGDDPAEVNGPHDVPAAITLDDFPETLDDYYYKVAIVADRMLRGEPHLRI